VSGSLGHDDAALIPPLQLAGRNAGEGGDFVRSKLLHLEPKMF
jgi:hypothetical protein